MPQSNKFSNVSLDTIIKQAQEIEFAFFMTHFFLLNLPLYYIQYIYQALYFFFTETIQNFIK